MKEGEFRPLYSASCIMDIRSADITAGQSILVAPPSTVARPLAYSQTSGNAVQTLLAMLGSPYAQFPDAFLLLTSH